MAGGFNGGAPKYDAPPYYTQNNRSKRRRWCIVLTAVIVLVVIICAIAIPVSMKKDKDGDKDNGSADNGGTGSGSSLERACNQTRYPEVCMTSLSQLPNANTSNPRDLVRIAVFAASAGVSQELGRAQDLLKDASKDPNLSAAASDCVDNLVDSLSEINETLDRLNDWDLLKLKEQLGDLQTWMSSALTLQQTCHDDFVDMNVTSGPAAEFLSKGEYTEKLLSNALAMVNTLKTITNDFLGRRLLSDTQRLTKESEDWVSPLRKLLQSTSTVIPDAVVALDGTGDYTSIQKAVDDAPQKSDTRYVIYIKAGVYKEYVEVKKNFWNIMFIGDGQNKTIISGKRSVVGDGITTSKTGTLTVMGKGFIGRDFAVENTAGAINHQAVALRVAGDFSAFWRCTFLGFQDTLYTHTNRQFYKDCTVVGTVDFIFGNAAVVLQTCTVLATVGNPGQQNTYTAQGRLDPNQNTGISFQGCTIDATAKLKAEAAEHATYLGRPWKPYSVTVLLQSTLGTIVHPDGWLLWNGETQHLDTIYYAEYMNSGPGAGVAKRVPWSYQIANVKDARKFTANDFISAPTWLPSTNIQYTGSL
ncbi:hypothetical protein Mapa_008045 [Marchantia paleacea]|nr:hypothetical protein Mapa_008045 [Marchantia paleacea]